MWDSFDVQSSWLPVKRNRFLNDVIKAEIPRLASAMSGGESYLVRANRWIGSELNRLRPATVSIDIEKSVVQALNTIVQEMHMVRDAFFNRLVAFLRSSDDLLEYFESPRLEDGAVGRSYGKAIAKPVSPLKTLESTFHDPVDLHMAVEELHGDQSLSARLSFTKNGWICLLARRRAGAWDTIKPTSPAGNG